MGNGQWKKKASQRAESCKIDFFVWKDIISEQYCPRQDKRLPVVLSKDEIKKCSWPKIILSTAFF